MNSRSCWAATTPLPWAPWRAQPRTSAKRNESIGLIWFDAHGDMNIPESSPSGNIHGMPLAHLLGKGDEDLKNILGFSPEGQAGKRRADRHPGDRRGASDKIIRDSGIHAFTMREIDEHGMATVAKRALEVVNDGTAGFHVSFDVDGCDPTVIPGSGTLVPGGVSFREAHLLMEYVADSGALQSLEIVELNPFLDERNISAKRALELILSAMGKSIL